MRASVELGFERVTRAARAIPVGVAALDDKPWLHPVKGEAVIKAGLRQLHECGGMNRCIVRKKLEKDVTFVCGDAYPRGTRSLGVGSHLVRRGSSMCHPAFFARFDRVPLR